ncbi:MAG: putative efflux family protein [Clostridiaceae bacterium]|nr:putative efflux family protein [Clostridiaceae bacterium]
MNQLSTVNDSIEHKGKLKQIFQLSWPVMLGMILQSLLGTVDTYFISQLGTSQSAAASLSNSATSVIFVISTLVSSGTIALVSRSFGEGDMDSVRKFSGESIMLSLIIGGILSIACYVYAEEIIKILFQPGPVELLYAKEYLTIIFPATILVFLNSTLRTIFQAYGDTKTPLYIFGVSNIINAFFCFLFMNVLKFGIRGSAFAAVIAMFYSYIAINVRLIKKIYDSNIKIFINSLKIFAEDSIRILKIGSWACLQQVARPITGTLMFSLVYQVGGKEATAAFGIGGQLFNYTFIFLVGLSTAIAIMVGQSLGRGDINSCDRVIKEGMKLALGNIALFSILYVIIPAAMMKAFINNTLVIKHGVDYLRIVYVGIIFTAPTTIYGGVFQGAGDTFPPMVASMASNVVLKLPLAYLLAKILNFGTIGVWVSISMSVVIEAFIIIVYFKMGKWKEKKI